MDFIVMMRTRDLNDPETHRRRTAHATKPHGHGHLTIGGAIFTGYREIPARVWQEFEIIPYRIAHHYMHLLAKDAAD